MLDGLDDTFDEWIPLYSSRLAPYLSRLNTLVQLKTDHQKEVHDQQIESLADLR